MIIDIDDLHPESKPDCSGNMENGVFEYLNRLVKEFPKIKILLFITPNWMYRPQPIISKALSKTLKLKMPVFKWGEKFRIDKYPQWCEWLKAKAETGNFFIGLHGLNHIQTNYPFSAEFQNLNYKECEKRIETAENLFKKTGIPLTKFFRPPGWGVSTGLIRSLKERKYTLFGSFDAVSPPSEVSVCQLAGIKGMKLIKPDKKYGVTNITANCDIRRSTVERVKSIIDNKGLAVIHGHIENDYHGEPQFNGLTKESYSNLKNLINFAYPKVDFSESINILH